MRAASIWIAVWVAWVMRQGAAAATKTVVSVGWRQA